MKISRVMFTILDLFKNTFNKLNFYNPKGICIPYCYLCCVSFDWVRCIVNEENTFYPEVYSRYMKNSLVVKEPGFFENSPFFLSLLGYKKIKSKLVDGVRMCIFVNSSVNAQKHCLIHYQKNIHSIVNFFIVRLLEN